MIRLSDIFSLYAPDFLNACRDIISADQLHAIQSIIHCRSEVSARMEAHCSECDYSSLFPHSCGHRFCPHCQHHDCEEWLRRQLQRQVPADYFLITFTLPSELRTLALSNQATVYDLMMKMVWQTILTFSQNDKQLQGTPGAIAVLHTHSRRLDFHPHVHVVVPAAAIDKKKRWRKKRCGKGRFLFSHKALAKVFRGKLLAALRAAGLSLPETHPDRWVVDVKAVGNGEKALIYLGRYLYRGVIREKDILSCEKGMVTFQYQNAKTKQMEKRTLSGVEFMRLILQHVLPRRFCRARNYGFLHPNSKTLVALVQIVTRFVPPVLPEKARATWTCPVCQKPMVITRTRIRAPLPRDPRLAPPGMERVAA